MIKHVQIKWAFLNMSKLQINRCRHVNMHTDLTADGASQRTTRVEAEAAWDFAREPAARRVVPDINVAAAENANLVSRWTPLFLIHDPRAGRVIGIVDFLHHDTRAIRLIRGADLSRLGHLQAPHCLGMGHQRGQITRLPAMKHALDEVGEAKRARVSRTKRVAARPNSGREKWGDQSNMRHEHET